VVGRWQGGGTHTGPGFQRLPGWPAACGDGSQDALHGTTVLRLKGGKIVEEIGLDDGVTALTNSAS